MSNGEMYSCTILNFTANEAKSPQITYLTTHVMARYFHETAGGRLFPDLRSQNLFA